MAKENENLESTEETVEEVVADKDTEQEESIALASEKAKEKLNVLKLRKLVMLLKQVQVLPSSEVLPL